jgi:DNA-binding NarL/FixJ family response regulator
VASSGSASDSGTPRGLPESGAAQNTSERPVPFRVLVADDERAHRWLVRLQLQDEPDFLVVGEANDAAEAIARAGELRPDIVLVDVEMPGDGVAALPALRRAAPTALLVVLSAYADQRGLAERVAARGGHGVMDKDVAVTDLARRLRKVLAQPHRQSSEHQSVGT